MHVSSHTSLSLLARLMALGYRKLNVGSWRETHELECRNYVKHVRTSAKGLTYCGFISAFTYTSVVFWLQLQVPSHSGILCLQLKHVIKEILPSDTHWKFSLSSRVLGLHINGECGWNGKAAGMYLGFPNSGVGRDTIPRFQMVLLSSYRQLRNVKLP